MKENNEFYVGIDIGGTKILSILTDRNGSILERIKISTPKNSLLGNFINEISLLIKNISAKVNNKISAVGLAVAGTVNTETGEVISTPNINLSKTNLKKILEKKLKLRFFVGNDANLGLLGEHWLGVAKGYKNIVGIFIGTGIGGGAIIDGKLLTGTNGAALEVGHIIIEENGPKCSCGNRGCLEALAGRWAIEKKIKNEIKKGKSTILEKYIKKKKKIKSKLLRKALESNDKLVKNIIKDVSKKIGIACISIRHIFDPEIIVLGGGVIEACGDFMLPIIRKTFEKDKFFSDLKKIKILKSKLEDDAVALGAVYLAKSNVENIN